MFIGKNERPLFGVFQIVGVDVFVSQKEKQRPYDYRRDVIADDV